MTDSQIERLSFIKFLLTQAEKQVNLDRPLSSSAILTLHDAVECFLQLGLEKLAGKSKKGSNNILDSYTEELNTILSEKGEKTTISRPFIKRLNSLRNQLKHESIFIDFKEIERLYSESTLFFIDFTKIIFDLNFEDVSLLSLISNQEIRSYLINAKKEIDVGNLNDALISIAKAFYEIEYITTVVKNEYGYNLLAEHHKVDYQFRHVYNSSNQSNTLKGPLKDIAEDINRLQDELHQLKKIFSMSIDLKEYVRFNSIVPYVQKYQDVDNTPQWFIQSNFVQKEQVFERVKFCFDFVSKTALKL